MCGGWPAQAPAAPHHCMLTDDSLLLQSPTCSTAPACRMWSDSRARRAEQACTSLSPEAVLVQVVVRAFTDAGATDVRHHLVNLMRIGTVLLLPDGMQMTQAGTLQVQHDPCEQSVLGWLAGWLAG